MYDTEIREGLSLEDLLKKEGGGVARKKGCTTSLTNHYRGKKGGARGLCLKRPWLSPRLELA